MAITPPLPIVGNSEGTWGTTLNQGLTDMDDRLVQAITVNGNQDTSIASNTSRLTALEANPMCKLSQNTAQTITNNSPTPITFTGVEEYDPTGMHDPASNTSRITPTKAGWYLITGAVPFPSRTDWTMLMCYALKGGNALNPAGRIGLAGSTNNLQMVSFTTFAPFNGSTEYVELVASAQNAAAASFQPVISGGTQASLAVMWVRGL
jgi:hypothetical protein